MSTTAADQPGKLYEATVREMISREDELTNQRMLWMAAFNGLLFAALGFAWDKPGATFLTTVFSVLGVAASFLNGLALIYASNAQRRLLIWWHNNRPDPYAGPVPQEFAASGPDLAVRSISCANVGWSAPFCKWC